MNIIKEDGIVSICADCNNSLNSFIDIYTNEDDIKSPFKTTDDAELFAKLIIKMLQVINNDTK